MSDHADYMRNWRRLHGMVKGRAHDPLPDEAELERRGKELATLMMAPVKDLHWPRDLFGNNVTIATLMAEQCAVNRDTDCICGRPHRNNISRTMRSVYGNGWTVAYYCSDFCKGKHAKEGAQ